MGEEFCNPAMVDDRLVSTASVPPYPVHKFARTRCILIDNDVVSLAHAGGSALFTFLEPYIGVGVVLPAVGRPMNCKPVLFSPRFVPLLFQPLYASNSKVAFTAWRRGIPALNLSRNPVMHFWFLSTASMKSYPAFVILGNLRPSHSARPVSASSSM